MIETIESLLTSAAILAGGVWAWYRFRRHRTSKPRVGLQIFHDVASATDAHVLVHVGLQLQNVGDVLVKVESAEIRLRQVLPIPETLEQALSPGVDPILPGRSECEWPMLACRSWDGPEATIELEPSEADRLHADFFVESEVRVIQLYAYVRNVSKPESQIGWTATEIVHIGEVRDD